VLVKQPDFRRLIDRIRCDDKIEADWHSGHPLLSMECLARREGAS
jgi:hypothetical protein